MRAFVAVPLAEEVREALADALTPAREAGHQGLRWSDPATWHVTLRFLGEVEPALAGQLQEALAGAVGDHPPFTLRLGPAGDFGRSTLWYGVQDRPAGALAAVAADVREATARLVPDAGRRPFRPHLTVARTRRGARLPSELPGSLPAVELAWSVGEVVLYRSELRSDRAHHDVVARVAL